MTTPTEVLEAGAGMKQRWLDRAARYDARAEAAEAKAKAIYAAQPAHARDPAFVTQPARSSHAVAREQGRLAERDRRAWELEERAKEYREKAKNLRAMASRNKGDAEREREVIRQALDLSPGDMVSTLFGIRQVTKVNAKSIRVEGVSSAIEKHLVRRVAA